MERLSKIPISALHGKISEKTYNALCEFEFQTLTDVQAKSIPRLLTGCDGAVAAKTGSGKTLAFLIPAIELLLKVGFKPNEGTGVLIISPTRELCIQIHIVAKQLLKYHEFSLGRVIGGTNRNTEKKMLSNHINILVATPGRLLDHLQTVENFVYKNLKCLILDEADRILDQGFERDLTRIINILPKKRQTLLFSATLTKKTEDLVRLALKNDAVFIGVDEQKEDEATIEGLNQGFIVCPAERKLLLLFTFLKRNKTKKIMVFFSTCHSVKFHDQFFKFLDLPITSIQGHLKQNARTKTYMDFCKAETGILLCTDVAARGLDIPKVDWIIQFDPPTDAKEYIHRVGRTARGENVNGNAWLIVLPEEQKFVECLKLNRIPIKNVEFEWTKKTLNKQTFIQDLISKNPTLVTAAKKGFKSYFRAYKNRKGKLGFDIRKLDIKAVAKSFGFQSPPLVKI